MKGWELIKGIQEGTIKEGQKVIDSTGDGGNITKNHCFTIGFLTDRTFELVEETKSLCRE